MLQVIWNTENLGKAFWKSVGADAFMNNYQKWTFLYLYSVYNQRHGLNQTVLLALRKATLTLANRPMVGPSSKDFSYALAGNRFGTLQDMVIITGKLSSCSDAERITNTINTWERQSIFPKMTADKIKWIHYLPHVTQIQWQIHWIQQ